ncbi:MAG: EAL domain-containing protein, partial [Pseudomonadota bacterium]
MPSPHFVPSGSQGEMPAFLANATADAAEVDRAIALAERALAEGRVRAVYQPVVDARHGCRVGFHEALMRIATPTGGFLSPAQFLPALAGTDLAADLDLAVLDQALTMLAENPTARISVNVAAASVRTPAWMDRLIAAAGARPDVPFRLIVEIAEDNETLNGSDWAGFLASVAQLGVTTAIDDFGAGATGFEQLRQHRFDVLKIDGSYGDGLARCP